MKKKVKFNKKHDKLDKRNREKTQEKQESHEIDFQWSKKHCQTEIQ